MHFPHRHRRVIDLTEDGDHEDNVKSGLWERKKLCYAHAEGGPDSRDWDEPTPRTQDHTTLSVQESQPTAAHLPQDRLCDNAGSRTEVQHARSVWQGQTRDQSVGL